MKLTELAPQFLVIEEPGVPRRYVATLAEAQGIRLICPKCIEINDGAIGTHEIVCWFHGCDVIDDESHGQDRWYVSGTEFDDLTLRPAVFSTSGCAWRGYVNAGIVSSC